MNTKQTKNLNFTIILIVSFSLFYFIQQKKNEGSENLHLLNQSSIKSSFIIQEEAIHFEKKPLPNFSNTPEKDQSHTEENCQHSMSFGEQSHNISQLSGEENIRLSLGENSDTLTSHQEISASQFRVEKENEILILENQSDRSELRGSASVK